MIAPYVLLCINRPLLSTLAYQFHLLAHIQFSFLSLPSFMKFMLDMSRYERCFERLFGEKQCISTSVMGGLAYI